MTKTHTAEPHIEGSRADTAVTTAEIAEAIAKRVARVGDFDDNVETAFARHGIELADGGFTITRDGQTFRLTVTEPLPTRRPFVDAASAIHRTQRPDPQDVAAQVARIVTHCTVDGAPEWAEQAAAKLPPEILPQLATGARALASVLARTCLCERGSECRQFGCPACAELSPWSECRVAELGPHGAADARSNNDEETDAEREARFDAAALDVVARVSTGDPAHPFPYISELAEARPHDDERPPTVPPSAERVLGAKRAVVGWVWPDPVNRNLHWYAVHAASPGLVQSMPNQHHRTARDRAIGWVLGRESTKAQPTGEADRG